jgi:hypothetical protein
LGGAALGAASDQFSEQAELSFVSCSGAVAANVALLDPDQLASSSPSYLGGGRYHGVAQLEAGYLDESTDIVFVSLGGNDARFSDVLTFCLAQAAQCQRDTMPGDTTDLDTAERRRIIVTVQLASREALERERDQAPSAHIVLYADTIDTSSNWP